MPHISVPHIQDMFRISREQPNLTEKGPSLSVQSMSGVYGGETCIVGEVSREEMSAVSFVQQLQHVASMGQNSLPVLPHEELHKMQNQTTSQVLKCHRFDSFLTTSLYHTL